MTSVDQLAEDQPEADDTSALSDMGVEGRSQPSRWQRIDGWLIELVAGLIALAMGIYQLTLPHVLKGVLPPWLGYDDGVYMGVAIRLTHGVLPYRDFVFVHPPGIALLMSPVAAFGSLTGSSANSLILARVITVIVVAVNVTLVGHLVRPIGRSAAAVASFSLALWPLTVGVNRTLELEPYLVLFCLLGALAVFGPKGQLARRRLIVGGLCFGFAFVVKVWAIMPIVAVVLVFLPRWRREGRWLVLGIAAAIGVCCLPFLLAAPHAFVHDVFIDQLYRQSATPSTSLEQHLYLISGLGGLTALTASSALAVAGFLVTAIVVVIVYGIGWRQRTCLEWYVMLAAVITFVGMFDAPFLEPHYAYFPVTMLAPLLGVCVARLLGYSKRWRGSHSNVRLRPIVIVIPLALVVFAVGFLVQQDTSYAKSYLAQASSVSALEASIPPGACTISDYPGTLVMANRFTPSTSGCPAVIDPFGMYLSDDNGGSPHVGESFPAAFKLAWFSYLQGAEFVELRVPYSDFIPWTDPMILWFQQNYRQVSTVPDEYGYPIYLYQRIR